MRFEAIRQAIIKDADNVGMRAQGYLPCTPQDPAPG
jgi:hypothetical protein